MLRFETTMQLPDQIGFMILSDVVLFPQALLPLYIFEERYRSMLRLALDSHRMFGISTPNFADSSEEAVPQKIAGIGLIRACVDRPDGTSNLILEGISRIRVKGMVQEVPYPIAEIEPVRTEINNPQAVEFMARELLDRVATLHKTGEQPAQNLVKFLSEIKDFDALADIVAYSFIESASLRQSLLETVNLTDRIQKVLNGLDAQNPNKKPPLD